MLGKNFFGTKNNPKESLTEFMLVLKQMDPICARAQLEKGESGTPHFQWMVSLKKSTRLPKMHKLLPGCHVELAKNAMASWNYCGKVEGRLQGPEEIGLPPASKAVKGDTKARNALILEKGAMWAVEEGHVPIEKFQMLQSSINLFKVMKKEVVTNDSMDNEWHWGASGTGKSRGVRERYPNAFIKSNDKWWDGYNNEDVVIIEEMGPSQIGAHNLKIWTDHYPFKGDSKKTGFLLRPKKVIVTSNYSIRECYDKEQDYLPLERRFKVHHYSLPIGKEQ